MKSEAKRLKAEARSIYIDVKRQLDTVDCGLSLLCYLRPKVGRDIDRFRVVWARLAELDPDCPKDCPL
jgi:hypothetical protein